MSLPEPEVLRVQLIPHEELKAFVTIGIGPFELRGWRVIEDPEIRVTEPRTYTLKKQKTKLTFIHDEGLMERVREMAIDAYYQKLAAKQALAQDDGAQ